MEKAIAGKIATYVGVPIFCVFLGFFLGSVYGPYLTRTDVSCGFVPTSSNPISTPHECIIDKKQTLKLDVYQIVVTSETKLHTWHKVENVEARILERDFDGSDKFMRPLYWADKMEITTAINPTQKVLLNVYAHDKQSGNTYLLASSFDHSALMALSSPLKDKQLKVEITGDRMKPCTLEFQIKDDGTPIPIM